MGNSSKRTPPRVLTKEEIYDRAENRGLTNDELLFLESEIFYHPVAVLQFCLGENEYNKRREVTTAVNLLRAIDNIEDGDLEIREKTWLIDLFLNNVLGPVIRRDKGSTIDDVLKGMQLKTFAENLKSGSREDKDQMIFAEHFQRGAVLRELYTFDRETKEAIEHAMMGAGQGMKEFLLRGEIQTVDQLDRYCYYVAGRIGSFLTKLVKLKDRDLQHNSIVLDPNGAEDFGAFLQLANIAQNVREDWEEGRRIYFPAMLRTAAISHQYMMLGPIAEIGEAQKQSLENMLVMAKGRFIKSAEYVSSIPDSLRGYKTFSGMLLISGRELVKLMEREGAEAVFEGKENATRLSNSTLTNISYFSQLITKQPGKSDLWLVEYTANPDKFSFYNGKFREWAPKYTS